MKLYNTATHKIEIFKPINPQKVKIYTCGPTVYDYAHIGNFTSYVYLDLLIRTLKANHYQPYRILNFTDVGHLASDADDGIDKLEKGAKREGKTVWDIADYYGQAFLRDFKALNLVPPAKICRATDYIQAEIALVDQLTAKGFTYQTKDGIYFDTSKFKNYSKFARLDLDNLKAGARIAFNPEKRNPSDFAVWKFIQPDEDHAMQWQYLNQSGYPGWHLECSAIIHTELGETIDIHTGGIDHIPVHHTNEIAQTEAAYGLKMSNYWLHSNFITINGEKASKSLQNTYTLLDLQKQGFSPLDFKLWVLQGHYQSERNFSFEDLTSAKQRLLNWKNRIAATFQQTNHDATTPNFATSILDAVSDNLNSALALAVIDNSSLSLSDWKLVDQIFGLDLMSAATPIADELKQLISERESARQAKNYAVADQIRNRLETQNITVKDTPSGPIWQYLN